MNIMRHSKFILKSKLPGKPTFETKTFRWEPSWRLVGDYWFTLVVGNFEQLQWNVDSFDVSLIIGIKLVLMEIGYCISHIRANSLG